MHCIKALFIDLDGTVWDHHDISSLEPPFRLVDRDVIEDRHSVRVKLMPGIRTLLAEAKKLGVVIAALSWNIPERVIEALKTFGKKWIGALSAAIMFVAYIFAVTHR